MDEADIRRFVVFRGEQRIAFGTLAEAALAAARALAQPETGPVLVFDGADARVVDLDLRGGDAEIAARYAGGSAGARRGRPKLGVVAREVTLLPRHWDWLARQPGGASTTLRRLVDEARKADAGATEARARKEAAYRFMSAMAGDQAGFEEAARALFADDRTGLAALTASWPKDIAEETLRFLG